MEAQNLLFYDWNAGARQSQFGVSNNMRLSTRDDFRRTGMAEAKLLAQNKIDSAEIEMNNGRRRPITSDFRGGDRLPSRA